jgi:hypothetical protein
LTFVKYTILIFPGFLNAASWQLWAASGGETFGHDTFKNDKELMSI